MRRLTCLTMLLMTAWAGQACAWSLSAWEFNGQALLKMMQRAEAGNGSSQDAYEAGYYEGFIRGFSHSLRTQEQAAYCPPSNVTTRQLSGAVRSYVQRVEREHHSHPDRLKVEWNQPAVMLVSVALKEAFPCTGR